MSIFRRLTLSLYEAQSKTPPALDRALAVIEEALEVVKDKLLYYELKNFFKNLPHFLKQAWQFRSFDYSYSIEAFCKNLDRVAEALKNDRWHKGAKKHYRRCKTAAGMLRKAYNYSACDDKGYQAWADANPIFFEKSRKGADLVEMKTKYKNNKVYSDKMYAIIRKRVDRIEKQQKDEAWAYLQKHVESFWS